MSSTKHWTFTASWQGALCATIAADKVMQQGMQLAWQRRQKQHKLRPTRCTGFSTVSI